MSYRTPVAEIIALHKQYAELPEIVIAANRVNMQIESRIRVAAHSARMAQAWSTRHEWGKGVFTAVSAALAGCGIVWMVMR